MKKFDIEVIYLAPVIAEFQIEAENEDAAHEAAVAKVSAMIAEDKIVGVFIEAAVDTVIDLCADSLEDVDEKKVFS